MAIEGIPEQSRGYEEILDFSPRHWELIREAARERIADSMEYGREISKSDKELAYLEKPVDIRFREDGKSERYIYELLGEYCQRTSFVADDMVRLGQPQMAQQRVASEVEAQKLSDDIDGRLQAGRQVFEAMRDFDRTAQELLIFNDITKF